MATKFDAAVALLYQAPHAEFVTARKRLGNELAQSGDKPESALFAKLPRPSVSAWATNQLFWRARAEFDAFFASAARLRSGELEAAAEHRKQSTGLVNRAAEILKEGGNAATEATLRRVSANLAALAATGGFAPDPPGALKSDRDPPGFDAFASGGAVIPESPVRTAATRSAEATTRAKEGADKADAARLKAETVRTRAAAEAEQRRLAEERTRLRAERRELETALRTMKTAIERRSRERERLQGELAAVETELERARNSEQELSERLAKLPDD